MRTGEAVAKAAEYVAKAVEEEDRAEEAFKHGEASRGKALEVRAQLHASLATALMLTHGIVFTSSQGD